MNRRKFIQNSFLAGTSAFLTPSFLNAGILYKDQKELSVYMGGLTTISVIDNACILAVSSKKLSEDLQRVVMTDIHLRNTPGNKGRLAAVLPPEDKKIVELLNIVKSDKGTKYRNEKIAIACGWVAVNAVKRHISHLWQNKSNDELMKMRMHQDALVIQGVSLPEYDITKAKVDDVRELLNSMQVRTIARTHTLKPDSDDGIGYVNRISSWRRENKKYMGDFAQILVSPSESIAGSSFYLMDDLAISIANKLQKSQLVKSVDVNKAIENYPGRSCYAKALQDAVLSIFTIDDYLKNRMAEKQLYNRLKINVYE